MSFDNEENIYLWHGVQEYHLSLGLIMPNGSEKAKIGKLNVGAPAAGVMAALPPGLPVARAGAQLLGS